MCGVGRLLARPRIGAQFNVRRGFFRPAGCPRRLALRSCYDYVLGLWGWMKDVADGVPCPGRCFAPLARKAQYFGRGGWLADSDGLEGYGCKREIVVGVVLFHKLIEAECHIDWNVQNLALFAEVLVA